MSNTRKINKHGPVSVQNNNNSSLTFFWFVSCVAHHDICARTQLTLPHFHQQGTQLLGHQAFAARTAFACDFNSKFGLEKTAAQRHGGSAAAAEEQRQQQQRSKPCQCRLLL